LGKEGESYPAPQWASEKQLQTTNLEYNATYKWQAVVIQSDGQWATSTEWTFGTVQEDGAPQIELVSPADFATEQATSVTLTWEATPGTLGIAESRGVSISGYDIYFSEFGQEYPDHAGTIEKSFQTPELDYGTKYKWKVSVLQSDGKTATSCEWFFSTLSEVYSEPLIVLNEPEDGAIGLAAQIDLTWEATPGNQVNVMQRDISISEYLLYLSKSSEEYEAPQIVTSKELQKSNLESCTRLGRRQYQSYC